MSTSKRSNQNLRSAKKVKNDEFYTRLQDIEQELHHYWKYLENKTILCNCDDPSCSNFTFYFKEKFKDLKLKKLICTCYKHQNFSVFQLNDKPSERAIVYEYDGKKEKIVNLEGDGDFRSEECIKYLREADLIITNPPFSLFREFVELLITNNKKFLVIGNKNSITYKDIFNLIKQNKLWLGYTSPKKFEIPSDNKITEFSSKVYKVFGNIGWFTNLPNERRNEELILWKEYDIKNNPKYDYYDVINVDKVNEIPKNYWGLMGVPITFLDKYNPNQFEIIEGVGRYSCTNTLTNPIGTYGTKINNKPKFFRVFIKRRK